MPVAAPTQPSWAYAYSRMPDEPPIQFPDTPPDPANLPEGTRSYQLTQGIDAFQMPGGVSAYRVSADYQARMQELDRQAKAARLAAEQAAQDAQMMMQMSRVAKSTKDIEIARRSIDMMGLQRDIQSGVPIHEAISRWPNALGSGYGAALRATAPEQKTPAPEVVNLPGMPPGVRSGRYGERFQFPPASATELPIGTEMSVAKDPETGKRLGLWARTSRGARRLVLDPVEKGLTPGNRISIYNSQARIIADELDSVPAMVAIKDPKNPQHSYYTGLHLKLKEIKDNLDALGKEGRAPAIVAQPVAVLGQGTREDPVRPETQAQMDSIPSGAIYRNPSDGKLYRKK